MKKEINKKGINCRGAPIIGR